MTSLSVERVRTKRTVLHVVASLSTADGISVGVLNIFDALRRYTDWRALLLTGRFANVPLNPALELGDANASVTTVSVLQPFGQRFGQLVGYPRGFVGALNRLAREADIVHFHGMWLYPTLFGCPVVRRLGIPYVLQPWGLLMPAALGRKSLKKHLALIAFEARNLSAAGATIATSVAEVESIERIGVRRRPELVGMPLNRSAEQYFASHARPDHVNRERRVVLAVCRLHSIKRIVELVEAFGRVKTQFPQWNLEIAGAEDEPGYLERVRAKVHDEGLSSRVSLLGRVTGDALWRRYQHSDLFVLPSESESFGLVVIEALAAGLPVIATTGTPWQRLEPECAGWWVGPSVGELATALRRAMTLSVAERDVMAHKGIDWVTREYAAAAIAPRLADIYARLGKHRDD